MLDWPAMGFYKERERERDVWNLLFHLFGWTELMRINLIFLEPLFSSMLMDIDDVV